MRARAARSRAPMNSARRGPQAGVVFFLMSCQSKALRTRARSLAEAHSKVVRLQRAHVSTRLR